VRSSKWLPGRKVSLKELADPKKDRLGGVKSWTYFSSAACQ